MKKYIITTAILAASVVPAFAEYDGDHAVRPRPEFRGVQAEVLRAERVNTSPTGVTTGITVPAGAGTTTTNFGFEPLLVEVFDQAADAVDNWYVSDYTERS